MAVPERVNLFRAQASRAIGGNGRRTSHNPPDSSMLQIYDRVGIVVMDENRLFANETRCAERRPRPRQFAPLSLSRILPDSL